jgi:hypothetical protein
MKGNPFENMAIAMIVGAKTPTVMGSGLNCVDDGHDRSVEERQSNRRVDLHELARLFAAAVVARVAMIRGACRYFVVLVAVVGVRMAVSAAHHWQNLRLVAACCSFDMLMMPAATDERVHEQRGGGEGGNQSMHAWSD